MNYEDDYGREPELSTKLTETIAQEKVSVKVDFDSKEIAELIASSVTEQVKYSMASKLRDLVKSEVDGYYRTNEVPTGIKKAIREAVVTKVNEKYPDIVENKVNEFVEAIKAMKFEARRSSRNSRDDLSYEGIEARADAQIKKYIETELMDAVKMTKDEVETFAKNYFTNNLFKAMDFMNKQIEAK